MYIGRTISGAYQLVCSAFSILALRLHAGLTGLAVVLLLASLLQLLAMQASLARVSKGKLAGIRSGSRALIARLWRVSLPFGLVSTGGYMVGAAQVPLLGALLGPAVVAPMYIALRISQALGSTVLQVVIAQLPFFTQHCAQGHWLLARRRMLDTLIAAGTSQAVIALGIYIASPILVDWWVGPGHYIGGPVLLVFAINYAVTGIAGLPAQFVLASGRNPFAVSTIAHGIVTLGGMVILCPRIGLLGAPLAGLLAVLVTNFWLCPVEGWKTWRNIRRLENQVIQA
jgi:O-antigen/teichoic acid export membrane protein